MHFTKKNSSQKREELKNKLKKQKILKFPGAYNPLCAKLIAEIGFDGIYISGGVMANDLGIPDIGLTTLDHVSYRSAQIAKVTDLPSIVDADTGFKDCAKTISSFEEKAQVSKAFFAALTALSTSFLPPRDISAQGSSFDGSITL